jgi:hypothetical protein
VNTREKSRPGDESRMEDLIHLGRKEIMHGFILKRRYQVFKKNYPPTLRHVHRKFLLA